jgi:tyrosinase
LSAVSAKQSINSYWDWTIDKANISRSPIWDSFGGDGNSNSEQMKTLGYCVEDGPFAFYESKYWLKHLYPHCLTRRFDKNGPNPESYSEHLGPEAMQNLFSQTTYEDFCTTLETQVHDAIPTYIGGEFYWFTAPNGT